MLFSRLLTSITTLLVSCTFALSEAPGARAAHSQEAMFMDTVGILTNPVDRLAQLRQLGVDRIRLFLTWSHLTPNSSSHRRPRHFVASDPKSYSDANWAPYDRAIIQARADHIGLDIDIGGGAPLWATGPGAPRDHPHPSWDPSPSEYGAFVKAVGTRYSGKYNPTTHRLDPGNPNDLPPVHFWSIWNEPDYGPSLAPQGLPGNLKVEHAPMMYRNLVDAAWTALGQTGHRYDTVLIGELAPRGYPNPEKPHFPFGLFSGMKALVFLRALYCVDIHYHQLRGQAASLRGCPTNAAGSRAFRGRHPGLFRATGFSDHPYSRWYPPNVELHPDPDYSALAQIGQLERALDRVQRAYGSSKRFPIWNTEYGYLTNPPKRPNPKDPTPYVSQSTAAYYMNWAEYISWHDPRIQSSMQYLLADGLVPMASNDYGGFASGLISYDGKPKPGYAAYRMPLYMPITAASAGSSLEVWGCVRPAHVVQSETGDPQVVEIQFQQNSRGPFKTVQTLAITDPHGYFDTQVAFPSSGRVRLMWSSPPVDAFSAPTPVYSRVVQITLQ